MTCTAVSEVRRVSPVSLWSVVLVMEVQCLQAVPATRDIAKAMENYTTVFFVVAWVLLCIKRLGQ